MNRDELSRALLGLVDLVSRLRGPGGCPWDAKQTDETVKMYLLEEAYEALDAIEKGDPGEVCSELGDLLFQILFLARMAEERGEFDVEEVLKRITEKMINRHPHVFGSTEVKNAEEVAENWVKIKETEKGKTGTPGALLQGVPLNLPALLRAHRLTERVSRAGQGGVDGEKIWPETEARIAAFRRAVSEKGDQEGIGEALGDLLFSLADLARHWGLNAEHLLREANRRFLERRRDGEKP